MRNYQNLVELDQNYVLKNHSNFVEGYIIIILIAYTMGDSPGRVVHAELFLFFFTETLKHGGENTKIKHVKRIRGSGVTDILQIT